MELLVTRKRYTPDAAIGELHRVDGEDFPFLIYTLEDVVRGLDALQPIPDIVLAKVQGRTAIPTGRYEVILSYSNRFHRELPMLLGVPAFDAIRIHGGNTSADTEGCILVGTHATKNGVFECAPAVNIIVQWFRTSLTEEKSYITIQNGAV